MRTPLRVLLIEDSEDDATLVLLELRRGEWEVAHERVDTAEAMIAALEARNWDLIISDYSMPGFNGIDALAVARKRDSDLPFILVSATVGEDVAVHAMKSGANDYLVKGNLRRLGPAVERELREAEIRREARRTELALRKAHDDLAQAKEAAEAANRAKDQFLSVLSHELRTPLTPVLALVSHLETEAGLPETLRSDLGTIRRNVEIEARLIDDLLDLTRIIRNKMELHFETVDIHAAVGSGIELFRQEMDAKRLALTIKLSAERRHVRADPDRLHQVLTNLLSNAVKFTPAGGAISVRSRNDQDGGLKLEISDNGIGIEPDVLPRLFNHFEQGERTVTRRFGGLGLGLSIAKSLMEMQNGRIAAASEGRNKGTTLTIEMGTVRFAEAVQAMVPAPSVGIEPPPAQQAPPKPRACRILLVEDDPDTCRVMARLLQKYGYSVATAASVKEALQLINRQTFDLLLSDIGLPDGSGIDIMVHVKARSQTKGIAISGFGQHEDVRRSREAGFDVHLTKPVDFNLLQSVIQKVAG
jgi:signal transduction histidine kinase